MERAKCSGVFGNLAIFTMTLALGVTCTAQEQSQEQSREATPPAPDQQRHKADGERHGLPIEACSAAPVSRFQAGPPGASGSRATHPKPRAAVRPPGRAEAVSAVSCRP